MGIVSFSIAMIAVDMMLVSDKTWRRAAEVAGRWWDRHRPLLAHPRLTGSEVLDARTISCDTRATCLPRV